MTVLLALFLFLQQPEQEPLTIIIENVKAKEGNVILAVFKQEKDFLKSPYKSYKRAIETNNSIVLKITDVPYGNFAISIFLDENKNDQLDTNTFGIPKESFGFSNNKMGLMGPPSYEDCKIEYNNESNSYTIKLKSIL